MNRPAPTIDDLRVKLCWICREEEVRDKEAGTVAAESGPRKTWVHPCSCTLVAHQDCLLEWIKESQSRPARRANALKCPQCNTKYIIESQNPLLLRIFDQIDQLAARGGIYVSLGVVAGLGATFLASIYGLSTYYGAQAIRVFVGDRMYNLLIGDDPKNWHWSVYWNLPLVPIYLMATHATSRVLRSSLSISNMSLPIIFWLAFPSSTLSMSSSNLMPVSVLAATHGNSIDFLNHSPSNRILTFSHPPSPALCLLALPFLRAAYVTLRRRFTRWVLQIPPNESLDGNHLLDGAAGLENAAAAAGRRQVWVIGGDDDDDADVDGDMDGDMNGDGDVGIGADIRIDVDIDRAEREENQQQQPEGQPQLNQNEEPNPDPNAVVPAQGAQQAEAQVNAGQQPPLQPVNPPNQPRPQQVNQPPRRVRLTFSSFGRFLTKVLLTPWIASYSGRILEVISRKWGLLRRILAIDVGPTYPINGGHIGTGNRALTAMGWIERVILRKREVQQIPVQGLGLGQSIWHVNAVEPIWWRNTVGLSLWILTRDAITILHLLLKRREMKSRKIVNRSFEGIDAGTLDLIR